ncbi:ABC transporter ATP-binding protein [Brevibacillus marinus]|uniref:ABC transporter ATP-binding protein n=1 Tax=Brevibacillus marinus TaxID=2496837 RepID=UPI000F821696|nr:ABC transporter ATP-binding protein [Brevibacillus marinus]
MSKLLLYLQPYRVLLALVMGLVFLQTLSELYLPTLMADIVNFGVQYGNTPYILKMGGWMLLVAAFGVCCTILASYFSAKAATGFGRDLRSTLFEHVMGFSQQEFDQLGTASLITRTTNDVAQVQQVLMMTMRMMIVAPLMAIGGIVMALSKDAALALVIIGIMPILGLAIYLIARKSVPLFKVMQRNLDQLNLVQREGLTGIRVIRAFNRSGHEKRRFETANRNLTATALQVNRIMALMMPMMMLILNVSSLAIIWFGGIRVDQGHLQVGDLMAFLQYSMMILFSLIMLSMMFVMLPRAAASAARIREVLELAGTIHDASVPEQAGCSGHVEFRNVTFRYPGAEQPVLENISFEAKPGEVTAIIGGTGSGKSTLVNLIPRFYDAESGRVLIDGVDVRELTQESLRKKIGFVPQKAVLFSGTIADNIRYGKEDATDEEVRHAAEVAQALEFILEMEGGFDAPVAQGGANLSGGQKQRLSIARALVRRPAIYVFDDSFSALDYKTDAQLRKALKEETGHATVIIVAQRIHTVIDADRIVVLENGRVAGIGTHQQLLQDNPVYQEIVASQLAEEESA